MCSRFIRDQRRWLGSGIVAVVLLVLLSVLPGSRLLAAESKPSATVEIQQTQIAFIGSGNLGGGKLFFNGKTYKFTIGGLGIGGFGVTTMTATGNVYNLEKVSQFAGSYAQGRAGITAGSSRQSPSVYVPPSPRPCLSSASAEPWRLGGRGTDHSSLDRP